MQTTIIHATTFTSWRKRETPADQGLGRRKSAGVARCANQLVATVLYEGASRLPRTVTQNGGSSPDCVSKPGSPSGSLITSERRVGSGATGVCASPSRRRLAVQFDSRCNGWNKWPQIALAKWLRPPAGGRPAAAVLLWRRDGGIWGPTPRSRLRCRHA